MLTLSPVVQRVLLSLMCEEKGFPSDCNEKSATALMAEWSATQSVVSGVTLLLSVGFWTVISDRIGRRGALIFSSIGVMAYVGAYTSIHFINSFANHWRVVLLSAMALNSALGSFIISLLAIFGQCGDLTEAEPQMRGWLFALIEGLMGACGIAGAVISALGQDISRKWLLMGCFVITFILFLYAIFIFPETLSPAIRSKPINWRHANIIGSVIFCCMTKTTKDALEEDAMLLYKRRLETHFGGTIPDGVEIPMDGNEARKLIVDNQDDVASEEAGAIPMTRNLSKTMKKPQQDDSMTSSLLASVSDSDASLANGEQPEGEVPKYIKPNNSILLLSICMALGFTMLIAYKSVQFPYLMDRFDATAKEYATMLSVEYASKGVGTFLVVPLIMPFLTTPMRELHAMMLAYAAQALCFFLVPLASSFALLTACFACQSIVSCLSLGFSRGLLTNQTSNNLQGKILALTCGLEVITMLFGGFGSSILYSLTNQSNAGVVFQVMGGCLLIAAIVPLFISDTPYEFNNRNPKKHKTDHGKDQNTASSEKDVSQEDATVDLGLGLELNIAEPPVVIGGEYCNSIN